MTDKSKELIIIIDSKSFSHQLCILNLIRFGSAQLCLNQLYFTIHQLLSNRGSTQTMHRAVKKLKMILRSFPSAWAGSRVSKIPTSGFRAHIRFCFVFMISCYTSNRSELKIAQIEAYELMNIVNLGQGHLKRFWVISYFFAKFRLYKNFVRKQF